MRRRDGFDDRGRDHRRCVGGSRAADADGERAVRLGASRDFGNGEGDADDRARQDACEAGVDATCLAALTAADDASTAALNTWTSTSQTAGDAATGACRQSLDSLSTALGSYMTTLKAYSSAVRSNSEDLVAADDALTESRDKTVPAARKALVAACGP